jgi:hypothetical protein
MLLYLSEMLLIHLESVIDYITVKGVNFVSLMFMIHVNVSIPKSMFRYYSKNSSIRGVTNG